MYTKAFKTLSTFKKCFSKAGGLFLLRRKTILKHYSKLLLPTAI